MRKALIAAAVATALFAVGAFAASFTTVQSEDVASGNDAVTACSEFVDVDFATTYAPTPNDWTVTGATVTFYTDGTGSTVDLDCNGFDATVEVEDESNVGIADGTAVVAAGVANVTFDEVIVAGSVGHASVLVDGQTLIDQTP